METPENKAEAGKKQDVKIGAITVHVARMTTDEIYDVYKGIVGLVGDDERSEVRLQLGVRPRQAPGKPIGQ